MIAKDFFRYWETTLDGAPIPNGYKGAPIANWECLLCGWHPCREVELLEHLTLMHTIEERQKFFANAH